MTTMTIYQEQGYNNRDDYLKTLAEDTDQPLENVYTLADLLGPEEDFDGLPIALQDF